MSGNTLAWQSHEPGDWSACPGWPVGPEPSAVAKLPLSLSFYDLYVSRVPGKGPRLLSLCDDRLSGSWTHIPRSRLFVACISGVFTQEPILQSETINEQVLLHSRMEASEAYQDFTFTDESCFIEEPRCPDSRARISVPFYTETQ